MWTTAVLEFGIDPFVAWRLTPTEVLMLADAKNGRDRQPTVTRDEMREMMRRFPDA